jgi:isoamylase
VKLLNTRRTLRDVEHERQRVSISKMLEQATKSWHGVKLNQPDWSDDSRCLALSAELKNDGLRFYLILNAYWESLKFDLPKTENGAWRRWIDTSLDSPNDISPWEDASTVSGDGYLVADRSVVMLTRALGSDSSAICGGRAL